MDSKEWSKMKQPIPIQRSNFGIITSLDEKYAVIFGGCSFVSSEIHVLDLQSFECVMADTKTPNSTSFFALNFAERASERKMILIHGFMRIHGHKAMPTEIVNLIVS